MANRNRGGINRLTEQEALNIQLGQAGSIFIDDNAQHTGPYCAITAIEDSIVDVSDCTDIELTMEDAADFTKPIGLTIF